MELLFQDVASLKEKLSMAGRMREEATAKDAERKKMWYSKEDVNTINSVVFYSMSWSSQSEHDAR